MDAEQPFSASSEFRSRNYSSLVALLVMVIDWMLNLRFEYTDIWRPPFWSSNLLYMCSRYMGLFFNIAHYTLIHTQLANAPLLLTTCRGWIIGLPVGSVATLLLLDSVLFLRCMDLKPALCNCQLYVHQF
ncbi:hypothetical protein BJ165DRAFT_327977 [Panaeolus papilionaceus]|nr:hypothetical protein BJ165DRAFT_327977 [Panaeolus papilionaceus]